MLGVWAWFARAWPDAVDMEHPLHRPGFFGVLVWRGSGRLRSGLVGRGEELRTRFAKTDWGVVDFRGVGVVSICVLRWCGISMC